MIKFFQNMVLRKRFGSKRGEVRGEFRRLHNWELYALLLVKYNSCHQIKKTERSRARSIDRARRDA
jgi:hypothetical protein